MFFQHTADFSVVAVYSNNKPNSTT